MWGAPVDASRVVQGASRAVGRSRVRVFVGRHARNLDGKSRVAIPAEYVNRLQPDDRAEMYVAPGPKGCIRLVPKSYWDQEFERLARESASVVPDEFYHHCQLRPVDKAGRLLLDDRARDLAGLSEPGSGEQVGVMVCGSGRYLQVWDRTRYESLARRPRDFATDLQAGPPRDSGRTE